MMQKIKYIYFNPRPPCGGRPVVPPPLDVLRDISIHAPRAGGDRKIIFQRARDTKFQSTPPVRGATSTLSASGLFLTFQSTPPVRGATISIIIRTQSSVFQSTPPVRGATLAYFLQYQIQIISIHAPRAGGDMQCGVDTWHNCGFQSTPPVRGATRKRHMRPPKRELFQSTPPVRGATQFQPFYYPPIYISIHAPRAGGDLLGWLAHIKTARFQSTPPVRGAT